MTSTPAYSLRPAVDADLEALYAIHKAGMRAYVEQTYGEWDEAYQRQTYWERWEQIQQDGRAKRTLDVVIVDGEVAGYLDVEHEDGFVALNNIRVAPALQGRGLGTLLVQRVIEEAAPLPVELGVMRVNPAQRLYTRLGFEVVAETETHLRMRYDAQR